MPNAYLHNLHKQLWKCDSLGTSKHHTMNKEELNERILELLDSPDNIQEFADLASPEQNWKKINKQMTVPDYIGIKQENCPYCHEPVRMLFDKFASMDDEFDLMCPHCKKTLLVKQEYLGYTSDIYLFRSKQN